MTEESTLDNDMDDDSADSQEAKTTRTKRVHKYVDESTGILTFQAFGDDGALLPGTVDIDPNELSSDITEKVVTHGLIAKISDAAAGKAGQDILDAMQAVVDKLLAGQWTSNRGNGSTVKVNKTDITARLDAMSDADKEVASALLAKMGITL
jgi:hypothetical protein